jgi:hypothetical protein
VVLLTAHGDTPSENAIPVIQMGVLDAVFYMEASFWRPSTMYQYLQAGMVVAINISVRWGAALSHHVAFGCSFFKNVAFRCSMASSDIVVDLCQLWCASCVVLCTA